MSESLKDTDLHEAQNTVQRDVTTRLMDKLDAAIASAHSGAGERHCLIDPVKLKRIIEDMATEERRLRTKLAAAAVSDAFAEALADALARGVPFADLLVLTGNPVALEGCPIPLRVSLLVPPDRAYLVHKRSIEGMIVGLKT